MKKPIIKDNAISVPSSQDYLVDVDAYLENYLMNLSIDRSVVADIAICVTELVINSIIHGNKSDLKKNVTITIVREKSGIKVIVEDQGSGFNPDSIENPIDDKNLLREVGRGIFIVKSLMDNVEIQPSSSGTRVTITKKL
jgi:serine/threonine-protein kinase RsbW